MVVCGKYVGWRNDNADCVFLCEKSLSLQTCMTQWNRTKPLPSSNSDKQYHNSCSFDLYTIFQLFWCCTILLCEEQTEISAFVFHKRKFGTTCEWLNDYFLFCVNNPFKRRQSLWSSSKTGTYRGSSDSNTRISFLSSISRDSRYTSLTLVESKKVHSWKLN